MPAVALQRMRNYGGAHPIHVCASGSIPQILSQMKNARQPNQCYNALELEYRAKMFFKGCVIQA